jgi:hypothetical protein
MGQQAGSFDTQKMFQPCCGSILALTKSTAVDFEE